MPRIIVPVLLLLAACGGGGGGGNDATPESAPPTNTSARLEQVATGLEAPVFATAPAADISRLFVVEQGGRIRIIELGAKAVRAQAFLDLSALVSSGTERGLLGMAFDPDYANNRRLYVHYTDTSGDIVIARYLRNPADPNVADTAATVLATIGHAQFANHNGGMLAFGPDGCLYAAVGDGGGGGDPNNNAQNRASRLGKILRLDASTGVACTNGIANPFAAGGGEATVWSYGLRNPWRFSFDRASGDLYIGDVGQATREEINAVSGLNPGRGLNFGWRLMEGTACFNPSTGCQAGSLTAPVLDYARANGACAVTGGYVYRGAALPALRGTYFYGDFCAGFVRSFRLVSGRPAEAASWPLLAGGGLASFGEDAAGELYVVRLAGTVSRIVTSQ